MEHLPFVMYYRNGVATDELACHDSLQACQNAMQILLAAPSSFVTKLQANMQKRTHTRIVHLQSLRDAKMLTDSTEFGTVATEL